MDIYRIIGIGIVLIIPAFVGAGALWDVFHRWEPVFVWVVLIYGILGAVVLWKFLGLKEALTSPEGLGQKALSMAKQSSGFILGEMERSPKFYVWLSILAASILLAFYALLASVLLSMEILEFSLKIPWAMLVSAYTWLVVAGSGLCIINGLGAVFGLHRYEIMTKRIAFLSLTSIVFGLSFILLHLGRPERVLVYNIVSPNFSSAISWMGALYNIYLVIVAFEFWLLIRADLVQWAENTEGTRRTIYALLALKKPGDSPIGHRLDGSYLGRILFDPRVDRLLNHPMFLRITGALAFVTGIAALTMLGSVFAHTESRALWYGAYYPVYFLISALFTGYALLLAVMIISYGVRRDEMPSRVKEVVFEMSQVLAFLLAVGFALTAYRLSAGLFDPQRQGPVMLILRGAFSPAFWGFEVALMSVIPGPVLLWAAMKKMLNGVLAGALMVLAGAFVMRYDFVVAGQVFPNVREGLPSYLPTTMECFIILGVFSAFLMVYSIGEKVLPLKEKGFMPTGR